MLSKANSTKPSSGVADWAVKLAEIQSLTGATRMDILRQLRVLILQAVCSSVVFVGMVLLMTNQLSLLRWSSRWFGGWWWIVFIPLNCLFFGSLWTFGKAAIGLLGKLPRLLVPVRKFACPNCLRFHDPYRTYSQFTCPTCRTLILMNWKRCGKSRTFVGYCCAYCGMSTAVTSNFGAVRCATCGLKGLVGANTFEVVSSENAKCAECGAELATDVRFCLQCGYLQNCPPAIEISEELVKHVLGRPIQIWHPTIPPAARSGSSALLCLLPAGQLADAYSRAHALLTRLNANRIANDDYFDSRLIEFVAGQVMASGNDPKLCRPKVQVLRLMDEVHATALEQLARWLGHGNVLPVNTVELLKSGYLNTRSTILENLRTTDEKAVSGFKTVKLLMRYRPKAKNIRFGDVSFLLQAASELRYSSNVTAMTAPAE